MRIFNVSFLCSVTLLALGCSPVKVPETNQYQLTTFSTNKIVSKPISSTLIVTAPEAAAGYQTQQMLYVKKPYQLDAYSKNSWTSPPADMLHPLITQSVQNSGIFYAVVSSPYNEKADYRLDTQLLNLEQNFLKKPSVILFSAKVVLTDNANDHILASQIYRTEVRCPTDTPYGGVIAANQAVKQFTAKTAEFIAAHLKHT